MGEGGLWEPKSVPSLRKRRQEGTPKAGVLAGTKGEIHILVCSSWRSGVCVSFPPIWVLSFSEQARSPLGLRSLARARVCNAQIRTPSLPPTKIFALGPYETQKQGCLRVCSLYQMMKNWEIKIGYSLVICLSEGSLFTANQDTQYKNGGGQSPTRKLMMAPHNLPHPSLTSCPHVARTCKHLRS